MNPLTLDEIREKAIEVIKENPTGIRQIDLIKKLVTLFTDRLSGTTTIDSRIRNAVWNLETKSDEVTKQSVGERNVIFLPKAPSKGIELLAAYNNLFTPAELAKGNMVSVWYLLTALEEELANNAKSVDRLTSMSPEQLATLSSASIETIFELQQAVNAVKRARAAVERDK
jgi:hypothetical protein